MCVWGGGGGGGGVNDTPNIDPVSIGKFAICFLCKTCNAHKSKIDF